MPFVPAAGAVQINPNGSRATQRVRMNFVFIRPSSPESYFPSRFFQTTNGHQSTRIQTSFDSVLQNKMKEAEQIQTVQDLCSLCCLLLKQSSCVFVVSGWGRVSAFSVS